MRQPLPPIDGLDSEDLTKLRQQIEERLGIIRAEFIEKAAALGLSVVDGDAKKRKRRTHSPKEHE